MRIETIPLILGVLIALLGIGIIFDAWTPEASVASERRRRPRLERHRNGEALIGLGVLALAAAFIGRDTWRYSVLVVIIGAAFLLVGAILNAKYVRELFVNRGPLRRRDVESAELPKARAASADNSELASKEPAQSDVAASTMPDGWDGMERRQTPRTGGTARPSQRRPPGEESARG